MQVSEALVRADSCTCWTAWTDDENGPCTINHNAVAAKLVLPQGHAYMHTGQHDPTRMQCKYSSCAQFKRGWLP
jgi:hypothetical protein